MDIFSNTFAWLASPANWSGSGGIAVRLFEHLQYSALVLAIAAAIAVPLGMFIGHTGRGRVVAVAVAGALRALPTLGLLVLFALLAGSGLMPPVWALVILTVPPLLAGSYAGISSVDRAVVDGARALGMTELQILFRVELPNGLPVLAGVSGQPCCRSSPPSRWSPIFHSAGWGATFLMAWSSRTSPGCSAGPCSSRHWQSPSTSYWPPCRG